MNRSAWRGAAMGMLAAILLMGLAAPSSMVGAIDRPVNQASGVDEPRSLGGPSPLVVPAAAFSSDGSDPDGFFFNFSGYVDGSGTACLKAPAYLPDGARVVEIWASLYDNATGDIYVTLRRVNVVTGSSSVMAEVSTVIDSTAIQQRGDTTINHPDVDYPENAYYLTTCLNAADHRLYSVRIYYSFHLYLPIVLRNH